MPVWEWNLQQVEYTEKIFKVIQEEMGEERAEGGSDI